MDSNKGISKDNSNGVENSKQNKNSKHNMRIVRAFPMPPQPENYNEINEIFDSGKRELVDYHGKKIPCDIFGLPLKKYFNDISGASDYSLRLSKNLINELKYDTKNLYIPITSKFEGSSMFPRPISIPFVNQEKDPTQLFKEIKIKKRMTEKKNKFILLLKKPSEDQKSIPSFICQRIPKENQKNKTYIMNLIDNYINKKKEQHKFDRSFEKKNKEIISLKNYKKTLCDNIGNGLYSGKTIPECGQKHIKEKYNAIRKLIYNNANKNKIINNKFLKKFNVFQNLRIMKNNLKHKERLNRNKSCNNFFTKNNLNLIKENKGFDSYINNNSSLKTFSKYSKLSQDKKNNSEIKLKSSNSMNNIFSSYNKFFPSNNEIKSNIFNNEYNDNIKKLEKKNLYCLYKPKDINEISDRKNKTAINFFKKSDNINNEEILKDSDKNNEEDLSLISDDKLKENSLTNIQNKIYNLKTIKSLQDISDKEKDLLLGYNMPFEEDRINIKCSNLNLKDKELENYQKDMKLFEIVNKIHLEKEREKNLFRENLLRKKLEGKKIFEKNFRKTKFK